MNRDGYLKLCNEFDPEKHDVLEKNIALGETNWHIVSVDDPLSLHDWDECTYKLSVKRRKLGQWVFNYAPNADYIAKTGQGVWLAHSVVELEGSWINRMEVLTSLNIKDIDHKDSLIFRDKNV